MRKAANGLTESFMIIYEVKNSGNSKGRRGESFTFAPVTAFLGEERNDPETLKKRQPKGFGALVPSRKFAFFKYKGRGKRP